MLYVSDALLVLNLYICTDGHSLQMYEVKSVTRVLAQEEEIAMPKSAKFEAKLNGRKETDAIAAEA